MGPDEVKCVDDCAAELVTGCHSGARGGGRVAVGDGDRFCSRAEVTCSGLIVVCGYAAAVVSTSGWV